MEKLKLKDKILQKKIIVWGLGIQGKGFINNYKKYFDEMYCTSNNSQESINCLKRIEKKDILDNFENYYIIICSNAYNEICLDLISHGLRPVENFIPVKVAEAVLNRQKIIMSVGQCELQIVNYIYNHMECLSNDYISIHYDEYMVLGIQELSPKLEVVMTVRALMPLADYFIYPVNLTKERSNYYLDILDLKSEGCKCLSVPLTTFEGYWPQDNFNDYYEISKYYYKDSEGKLPFGNRRDRNIESFLESGGGSEILEKIAGEDFYSQEQVESYIKKTIRKYEIYERKSDIKISDFFRDNYQDRKLFKDRGHAEKFVLREYARRILKGIEIGFDDEELEKVDLGWYDRCHSEFPIYPSVLKYLNFRSKEEYRFLKNGTGDCLDFQSYVRKIYEYIEYAKKLGEI